MSERPFMQLYVSDYLGDTRQLSCEQHGAYLLLLMTMWNAGGSLPDDDAKLARVVGLSVKRWRAIRPEILVFFDAEGGVISHGRLTKEIQKSASKSESRASAGAEGGRAKALKDKEARLANASVLPQHLPDTRDHIEEKETPTALSPPTDLYAFQGSTIRLTGRHLEQWRSAFPHITLESELLALDEWAGEQGGQWYHAVSSALAKKERAARDRINIRRTELEAGPAKRAAPDRRL